MTQPEVYANTIQSSLRRYGPMNLNALLRRTGLTAGEARKGLRFSRRNTNSAVLANEIIAVARLHGAHVYFLAVNDTEAGDYEVQRKAIALGHIQSVILLQEKRDAKWPNPSRAAAIKMLQMAHSLITTAP